MLSNFAHNRVSVWKQTNQRRRTEMTKTKKALILTAGILGAMLLTAGCAPVFSHSINAYQGRVQALPGDEHGYGRGPGYAPADGACPHCAAPSPLPGTTPSTGSVQQTPSALTGYGSQGALSDKAPDVPKMLTYALQDEYLARAQYESIIKALGNVQPFSNIIRAESMHISELQPLFAPYGASLPEDESQKYITSPADLTEAAKTGVQAEESNIAMYELFLRQQLPSDVRAVFEMLKNASERHKTSFQRWAN
jgi:hypothetical protein